LLAAKSPAVEASTNSRLACASATMRARLDGVLPGASGATTTPARSAPRKTNACITDGAPHSAIASPGTSPSRCSAAATRSMRASSAA
jgi:hypothetical protein